MKQQGFKEIVLLGQNVNSYNYIGDISDENTTAGSTEGWSDSDKSGLYNTPPTPGSVRTGRKAVAELTAGFTQPGQRRSGSVQLEKPVSHATPREGEKEGEGEEEGEGEGEGEGERERGDKVKDYDSREGKGVLFEELLQHVAEVRFSDVVLISF